MPILVLAFLTVAAFTAGAQQSPLVLKQTPAKPKVDGVMADKEYSLNAGAEGVKLGLTWTADALYVAMSGATTGWVAVGFGSSFMDSALIYIGFVSGGKTQLKIQKGSGHRHGDVNADAPIQYAMKDDGSQTTLELALKPGPLIAKSQKQLDFILAYGASDDFVSLHRGRYSLSVTLSP